MKSFNAILTIGSILAFAGSALSAPVPGAPGAQRIETVVEYVTEVQVVGVTMTVWVPPGDVATTEADPTTPSERKKRPTTTTEEATKTSSTTETTPTSSSSRSSSRVVEKPTTSTTPPPTTTRAPETTIKQDPTTPQPEPTRKPSTTLEFVPSPTPTPPSKPPPTGHDVFGHKASFYDTGMGSCGVQSMSEEIIVALSHFIMAPQNGGNPNRNPLCGTYIRCSTAYATVDIKVVDTCEGCNADHVDLSRGAFLALGGKFEQGVIEVQCSFI